MNRYFRKSVLSFLYILSFIVFIVLILSVKSYAAPTANTIRVATSGNDVSGCGTAASPCRTINYAVNHASAGDTILVASGTYTTTGNCVVGTAVICVFAKELTILGGYTTSNWSTADPIANLTIIDGQNSNRPILLDGRTLPYIPTIHLEGFTIQNGRVQGTNDSQFGGGLLAETGLFVLKDLTLQNNTVQGGNTSDAVGGSGGGGGMAILRSVSGTTLANVTFKNNSVNGGSGGQRGGYAIGGGLFTYKSTIDGNNLVFENNTAIAGSSNGSGSYNGQKADAQGAGGAFQTGSNITISDLTATGNQAFGGDVPNGDAGGAFGGGVFAELATISITDADIRNNSAQGGAGKNALGASGSMGLGGGIATDNTGVQLNRVTIINNTARGGNGTIENGSAGAGGANFGRYLGTTTVSLTNVIIADNLAEMGSGPGAFPGGGGGGLFINGAQVSIIHSTIAQNSLGSSAMQGNGIVIINGGSTTISHSIIANHTTPSGVNAVHAQPGSSVTFNNNLLSGNTSDTGGGGSFSGAGSNFNGSPSFAAPGSPNYDYHIKSNSAAIDKATGSTTTVDIDNQSRVEFNPPDVGADEFAPIILTAVSNDNQIQLSWQAETNLLSGLHHYQILVIPSSGASNPNEGTSINANLQTYFILSGLTNYKNYTLAVEARTNANSTIAQSNSVTAFPTDIHIYLPTIQK